jgi:hypothetical protein
MIQAQDLKIEEMRADFDANMAMADRVDAEPRSHDMNNLESRITALQSQVNKPQHGGETEGAYLPQNNIGKSFATLSARVGKLEAAMEARDHTRAAFYDEVVKMENSKMRDADQRPANVEPSQMAMGQD